MKKRCIIPAVIFMIAFPFALNEVMKLESFRDYIGKDTDWLTFWGGYLGAIISSIVAFLILWITYNQNEIENRKNRNLQIKSIAQNERENRNNRDLQIKTIEYQQQKDWLKDLLLACLEYISCYNPNDLTDAANCAATENLKCKVLIDNFHRADIKLTYSLDFESNRDFLSEIEVNAVQLKELISDIQTCHRYICENPIRQHNYEWFSQDDYFSLLSDKFKIFLEKIKSQNHTIEQAIIDYIMSNNRPLYEDVQHVVMEYYVREKQRVNKILNESNNNAQ